jgi:hypothetical protein
MKPYIWNDFKYKKLNFKWNLIFKNDIKINHMSLIYYTK